MRKFLLFIVVLATSVAAFLLGARAQRRAANRVAWFWFYQYLDADSARVECEMAQPIIFPRDTARIEL